MGDQKQNTRSLERLMERHHHGLSLDVLSPYGAVSRTTDTLGLGQQTSGQFVCPTEYTKFICLYRRSHLGGRLGRSPSHPS